LADLALIDPMYQFSLEHFNELFEHIIEKEKNVNKSTDLIKHLVECLTLYIFNQCSRALFEDHKVIFSFFIASKICVKLKSISGDEILFFLTGVKAGFSNFLKNFDIPFLEEKQTKAIQMLDSITPLKLVNSFKEHPEAWKSWVLESEPHRISFPADTQHVSAFHKCLIIKALRPEKLMFIMKTFIKEIVGEH